MEVAYINKEITILNLIINILWEMFKFILRVKAKQVKKIIKMNI